jgi:hypothetical protein
MPRTRARTYHLYSRTVVPIAALYAAGHALGHVLYAGTGHLGLFAGPLGDLRRAFLTAHPDRWSVSDSWLNWAGPLLCAALLLTELQRRSVTRSRSSERLLHSGFFLAAVGGVAGLLLQGSAYGSAGSTVLGATAVATAACVTTARWPRWTSRTRIIAVCAFVGGMLITLWMLRWRDQLQLGR